MGLKYKYVEVKISDLLLDAENPRFASSMLVKNSKSIAQEVIIEHLLKYAKISDLAKRINSIEELHGSELITCCEKNGEYVVIEGNRRVCACKLLLNRALIPDEYKSEIPIITKETRNNIEQVIINVYSDRESVQAYLSDRHIKGVKTWSSLEKNNYYMNLYNQYNNVDDIVNFTTDTRSTIRNCIIKYQFFMEVFNALQKKYVDIAIEKMDYLPLLNKFMNTLLGSDETVGLCLELNENNLKYYYPAEKRDLYEKILQIIGEAFLIRKEKNQCKSDEICKVVATELSTVENQKNIIINDERIPGLHKLIKEYKGIKEEIKEGTDSDNESKNNSSKEGEDPENKDEDIHNPDNDNGTKDKNPNSEGTSGSDKGSNSEGTSDSDKDSNSDEKDTENVNDDKYFPPSANSRPKNTPTGCLYFTNKEAENFKIYGNSNYELKIRSLLRDLAGFSVYKHPYTCALLYRTLLEATTRMVFERYGDRFTRPYIEDKLVDNLIYLNDNFLFNNNSGKDIPKIKKAIKTNLTSNDIIATLNLYIHYGYCVDEALLLSSWNTMKNFIVKCLEK